MADEITEAPAPAVESAAAEKTTTSAEGAKPARAPRPPRDPSVILTKPVPVPQPDEAAKAKSVTECKNKIAKMDKRIEEIRSLIEKQTNSRKSQGDETGGLKAELKTIRDKLQQVRAERSGLFEVFQKQKEARIAAQTKLKEMQKSTKFHSIAEIEERLRILEHTHQHETMSPKEEKELLREMKDLRKCKGEVAALQSMKDSVGSHDPAAAKPMQEELKEKDQLMSSLREREKVVADQIQAIREKHQSAGADIPELIKEQKGLYKDIRSLRDELRKIETEWKLANDVYYKFLRDERDYKRQQDDIRYEAQRKEREERRERIAKERAEEEESGKYAEVFDHPWAAEIFKVTDLISYCKTLTTQKQGEAKIKPVFDPAAGAEKGMVPIGKLVNKDDDLLFAGTKVKKSKPKTHTLPTAAPKEPKPKPEGGDAAPKKPKTPKVQIVGGVPVKEISHSLDSYSGFAELGITPPKNTAECLAAIKKLEAKKIELQSLTEEDKKKHKESLAAANKKAKEEAKQAQSAEAKKARESAEGGPSAAEVTQPAGIDFRKAVGAHV